MNKEQIKYKIKTSILEIQNPYPDDNMIESYKDFLRYRDFLIIYQYNPHIFKTILRITADTWNSNKRISRINLIWGLSEYYKKDDSFITDAELSSFIFKFYKSYLIDNEYQYSKANHFKIASRLSYLLSKCSLTPSQIEILLKNINSSNFVKGRVLRYPFPSKIISLFAWENINNEVYSDRRAELLSWIIDEKPEYKIPKEILIKDFEFHNSVDLREFKKYNLYERIYTLTEHDPFDPDKELSQKMLRDLYFKEDFSTQYLSDEFTIEDFIGLDLKTEKLYIKNSEKLNFNPAYRFYYKGTNEQFLFEMKNYELDRVTDAFYSDFSKTYSIFMAWSVFYSRIDLKQKAALLKKYFVHQAIYSYIRIAKKLNSVELLKWLSFQYE